MIDTLNMYCMDPYYLSQIDLYKFDNCTKHNGKYGVYHKGKIKNYTVTFSDKKLTLKGSLTKFYLGNNIRTMTRNQINEALRELESKIGISIDNFRITRIDLSTNFEMDYPIRYYLESLVEKSRYKKSTVGNESLWFSVASKTICFYDKMKSFIKKELRKKEFNNLPSGLPSCKNLLRYELQIMKAGVVLKKTNIRMVKDLCKDDNMKMLVNMWKNDFHSIKKNKTMIDIDSIVIKKPKDFMNLLICDRIEDKGKEETLSLLSKLCNANKLDRRRKYDLRRRIETNEKKFCVTSKYIDELETKISLFADNFI